MLFSIKFPTKKSVVAYVYPGVKGLQRLPCLKYYNVLKRESRFTLGLNAAKNTDYRKKISNKICGEFNFLQKTQLADRYISLRNGAKELQRLPYSK